MNDHRLRGSNYATERHNFQLVVCPPLGPDGMRTTGGKVDQNGVQQKLDCVGK